MYQTRSQHFRVDLYKLPFHIALNIIGIVAHLGSVTGHLLFAVGRYASVGSHAALPGGLNPIYEDTSILANDPDKIRERNARKRDNIASLLAFQKDGFPIQNFVDTERGNKPTTKAHIKSDFDALQECNRTIAQLKDKISSISTQITQSGSDAAEEIEARYLETQQAVIDLTAELKLIDDKLPIMERTLESKKKLKGVMSQSETEAITIEKETAFVDKCILALETIGRDNRMFALRQINVRLQQAYSALCEDYALGRRIYIVQFDDSARYQLVTFYEQKFLEAYNELCSSGRKKQLEKLGLSEDEIRETVIRSCAMSNSTGQSKMNTLAFVKAILDYANDPARNELFEVVKEYPLLIDAPFGDIFDHNLEKSADSLHLFSHQVILMLAKESYLSVARHIAPHIATVHVFSKEANEDHSSVSCISLEAI